jgi:hypothetical protein
MVMKIKKSKLIMLIISVLLVGILVTMFFINSNKLANTTISMNDHKISFGMTKDMIDELLGNGFQSGNKNTFTYDESLKVIYRDDKACVFEISDTGIKTYQNIQVGDSLEKVLSSYKKESKMSNNYSVAFKNSKEVDSISKDKDYWISYSTKDDIVTGIKIYDDLYAKELR